VCEGVVRAGKGGDCGRRRHEKAEQAQDAILDEIVKNASSSSTRIVALAEAWAWLMYPNQSHGGGSAALIK
jgi:hypothetical protein